MEYPNRDGIVDVILTGESRWVPAMFYYNGSRPVFARFGSEITSNVSNWRPHDHNRMHALKIVRCAESWINIQEYGTYIESYGSGEIWSYCGEEYHLSTFELSPKEFAKLYTLNLH